MVFVYTQQVNGQDLKYSTHLQAMQAIWNSGPHIKLCIKRKMSATSDCNFSFSESMLSSVTMMLSSVTMMLSLVTMMLSSVTMMLQK